MLWRLILWLTQCRSNVELAGQQKVKEGTVAEKIVVEGILVERPKNEKAVKDQKSNAHQAKIGRSLTDSQMVKS